MEIELWCWHWKLQLHSVDRCVWVEATVTFSG